MSKKIHYWDEGRKKILSGIQKVSDAVKVTMGPKGKNVILESSFGSPDITNDGVSVAKELEFKDKMQNIGASLVKEAANKTNDEAGDGTTTTTVLVESIVSEGLRYISSGVNPFSLGRGLKKASQEIVESLRQKAESVDSKEKIKQVASISAQDEQVGELISEVMEEVWEDGVVTVEEGKSMGLTKEVVKGMQFDEGYASPYFVTDSERMEAKISKPKIIITDQEISSAQELAQALENLAASGSKDIVIIADDIEGEALTTLVLNNLKGSINVLAVKAPGFGDSKEQMLEDIATVTGGQVISDKKGMDLSDVNSKTIGQADKIVSSQDSTTIVGGKGDQSKIESRADQIKTQMENTDSDYDKEKMKKRIARLVGWVAVIRVWAATEVEMKNKKYKIEDALNATRAAISEGITIGGGFALSKLADELDTDKIKDKDEQIGYKIVKQAISHPAKQIARNAGHKEELVSEKVRNNDEFNYGFDSKTGKYGDLIEKGIIDPVKVIRIALQESVSVASMVLTTEAIVVDLDDDEDDDNGGSGGGMWGGMPAGMWGMWGMWGMGGMM